MRAAKISAIAAAVCALASQSSYAFMFEGESVSGSFDTTITAGLGVRTDSPSCSMIGDPSYCGGNVNTGHWSNGDDGNLNYKRGQLFTAYLKGTSELLLTLPDQYRFMGRVSYLYDFAAANTQRTGLSSDARSQAVSDPRLLDLWVSKEFEIGEQRARWRLGNQVINWGESVFALGGINATNGYDLNRLSIPGTQLKEAVLPAPMLSFATGLGHGMNMEAYYQFGWNQYRFPPVGTYFSVADMFDKGRQAVYLDPNNFNVGGLDPAAAARTGQQPGFAVPIGGDVKARSQGQYGISMHYKPTSIEADLGFYMLNYHDKTPVLQFTDNGSAARWKYLEDRKLYGISANMPVGNWAFGTELSYRPHDAVSLSSCYGQGGPTDANTNASPASTCDAWIDKKKFQLHLTGLLSLTPSDHKPFLRLLGADTATFLAEVVFVKYPGIGSGTRINRTAADGTPVTQVPAAGYWTWTGADANGQTIAVGQGTSFSWGYTVDFNWTYDGTLLPGWQVTPGATYFQAVNGRTPSFSSNYMQGAKSLNLYVQFNKNPSTWQAGINYAMFFKGASTFDQPLADRNFFGAFISRNF
jgi:hypothetical protein